MNAAALERALSELRDDSEALWEAVRQGEFEALLGALERRESAFRAVIRSAGHLSPRARALLAEVQRCDSDALSAAQAKLATLRLELEDVRQARAALTRMRVPEEPARFLSERV